LINETTESPRALAWSSPVKDFLVEDFVLDDDWTTSHTTLEDALSHHSCFPRHDLAYGQWAGKDSRPFVKLMRHLPSTAQPRTKFQYCNLMYAVVSDVLETVTGKKVAEILREWIWDPLGMESTFFTLPAALEHIAASTGKNMARGYYWVGAVNNVDSSSESTQDTTGFYVPEPYLDLGGISGAGATISTVKDYALWVKALLEAAKTPHTGHTSTPISRKMFEELTTPRTILPPLPPSIKEGNMHITPKLYALGWISDSIQIPGHILIGHGGSLTGFGANVKMFPDDGFGVVTMGNTAGTSNIVGRLATLEIIARKFGLSEEEGARLIAKHQQQFSASQIGVQKTSDESETKAVHPNVQKVLSATLPLPGKFDSYTGIYFNPGYGNFTFTVAHESLIHGLRIIRQERGTEGAAPKDVSAALFVKATEPHTWPMAFILRHESGEFFSLEVLVPHGIVDDGVEAGNPDRGCGGGLCQDQAIWERRDFVRGAGAAFKHGPDGQVESVGLMMEPSMVEAGRRDGKGWERGLMWFSKRA
jgi:CubicO group peptidase (beta-lactamase class C family)